MAVTAENVTAAVKAKKQESKCWSQPGSTLNYLLTVGLEASFLYVTPCMSQFLICKMKVIIVQMLM